MQMDNDTSVYWFSYRRKFNLGNYENEDIEIGEWFPNDFPKADALRYLQKLVRSSRKTTQEMERRELLE